MMDKFWHQDELSVEDRHPSELEALSKRHSNGMIHILPLANHPYVAIFRRDGTLKQIREDIPTKEEIIDMSNLFEKELSRRSLIMLPSEPSTKDLARDIRRAHNPKPEPSPPTIKIEDWT